MTLADLVIGQRGRVREVAGGDDVTIRLLEMGMTPGAEVELVGRAPLGDPLEFSLRGYYLSVRRGEAARVTIEPA